MAKLLSTLVFVFLMMQLAIHDEIMERLCCKPSNVVRAMLSCS